MMIWRRAIYSQRKDALALRYADQSRALAAAMKRSASIDR
jgi:hypothetical protein